MMKTMTTLQTTKNNFMKTKNSKTKTEYILTDDQNRICAELGAQVLKLFTTFCFEDLVVFGAKKSASLNRQLIGVWANTWLDDMKKAGIVIEQPPMVYDYPTYLVVCRITAPLQYEPQIFGTRRGNGLLSDYIISGGLHLTFASRLRCLNTVRGKLVHGFFPRSGGKFRVCIRKIRQTDF
jgi:hypothetical protein